MQISRWSRDFTLCHWHRKTLHVSELILHIRTCLLTYLLANFALLFVSVDSDLLLHTVIYITKGSFIIILVFQNVQTVHFQAVCLCSRVYEKIIVFQWHLYSEILRNYCPTRNKDICVIWASFTRFKCDTIVKDCCPIIAVWHDMFEKHTLVVNLSPNTFVCMDCVKR